jgi:hypothetical protein
VPVTAKLIKQILRAGLATNRPRSIVDWFNAVDLSYQTQLRETTELQWQRFEARMDSRLSELRRDLMKWMFLYWVGSVVTLGGLFLGALKLAL